MKSIKVYEYSNCSTCKNALKFLTQKKVEFEKIDIVTNPPTKAEIKKMIAFYDGDFKPLFNTSGKVYQEMGLKDKVAKMTAEHAVELLSKNGKLIKRPFLLLEDAGLVGFKQDAWKAIFG